MLATIEGGEVTVYSRDGKIIGHNYIQVAKGHKNDAVIDGELVAIGIDGLSHFQLSRLRGSSTTATGVIYAKGYRIASPASQKRRGDRDS